MNPMMKDPAAGIPPQLLPHLHLVSKYRYPITSNPAVDTIVGYLLEAPKIVRDLQPMQWQFLDTPADGTLILEWQPLEYLGTSYASDGFIWADVEHVYKSEVRGYTLEMFLQRAGFRATGEIMATHSRRRYRLLPGNPAHGLPNPDPSLWLTHYSKASPRDQVPAANIPIMPHVHALLQQRRMIQSQGQLPRKEFMLHDRSNWPTMHLPPGVARGPAQGQIPPGVGHRRGASITQDSTVEEEEDVSRGDLLDFMAPRDISRVRYEQHHEWMEELIESPYPTLSIIPSELGFGKKGQLEELTKDFFDAPVSVAKESSNGPPPRVGKMPAGRADDFIKRASEKLAKMQEELEEMRNRHARRMEKLRRSTALTAAEKKLRTVADVSERPNISKDESNGDADNVPRDAIDDIMETVESHMGQKLTRTTTVALVSRGGLEERSKVAEVPAQPQAPVVTSPQKASHPLPNVENANTQQPQQPQPQPQPVVNTVEEPKQEQQDVSVATGEQQSSATAETLPAPSEAQPAQSTDTEQRPEADANQQAEELPQMDDIVTDVNMDGMDDQVDNVNQDAEEWVMIGEDGGQNDMVIPDLPDEGQQDESSAAADGTADQSNGQSTDQPQQGQAQAPADGALNTPDFGMGGDFDNVEVDTAGDALASYDNDDDLNLDAMEGSAFGDAFHPEEDEEIS
ncbi:uncharacterized protein Z520_05631 [Fonsecaea multimorphosa CBS 102226]|uniref:DUF1750-domain-containing protein n=1 Tax=Fonsecaea multimorphosa CBS 102226 TaxID=1442371 RepID=A0A0D2H8Y4_9EURO|nr:uncharacterized protein Z520_05631 [Fonsecaea multimorphosa CBS 102226]KIX98330.1 hypothetical protein Z520_05631 [Fonsecaea multimorphosa CBS 102226]OAL24525.1 hypothetical protein AYO22_05314 [Fonsecaea multimorphosa]